MAAFLVEFVFFFPFFFIKCHKNVIKLVCAHEEGYRELITLQVLQVWPESSGPVGYFRPF